MDTTQGSETQSVSLDLLRSGFPRIPAACGEVHAQAAAVCLHLHEHQSGVELAIGGDYSQVVRVEWKHRIDEAVLGYWKDLTEAVEQGAVGIAILLAKHLEGYTIVERAVKGSGIDWWLGKSDDPLFQKKARLEVSGMMSATKPQISSRVRLKIEQSRRSDDSKLTAYVIVVEFSAPQAQVIKR
jgi:hypothetical protein